MLRRVGRGYLVTLPLADPNAGSPLRVLIVLNGSFHGYSGGDLHTLEAAKAWADVARVEVLLPHGSSDRLEEALGVDAGSGNRPSKQPTRPRILLAYIQRTLWATRYVIFNSGRWDLAVGSTHFFFDVVPVLAVRGSVWRAVYWHHHVEGRAQRPLWLHLGLRITEEATVRVMKRRRVKVLTSSRATRDFLMRRGMPSARIAITTQGEASSPEVSGEVPEITGRRFVLFCSRQSRLKGAGILPELVPRTLDHASDTAVVVCGSSGDCSELVRDLARQYSSTGRVLHLGFVSDGLKAWLQSKAHVVIAPSLEEGWGYTIGEGLRHGCWVVTYDLSAVRAAHPCGPVYVPVGDTRRFIDSVIEALDRPRGEAQSVESVDSWSAISARDWRHITAPMCE